MRKRKSLVIGIMCMFVFSITGCNENTKETMSSQETVVSAKPASAETLNEMYEDSIVDAMNAEEDEIAPVIAIKKGSSDVIFNQQQDKVLMLTLNNDADNYADGSEVNLESGEVWVTSAEEMKNWYEDNKEGVEDWSLRLKQLIGLPPEDEYSYMTLFWVNPEDMFRPAYNSDIADDTMVNCFDDDVDADYKSWFDDNIVFSYYDDAYPWTRLGYTYDWADNGTDKGVCEFIVNQDSNVKVVFTKEIDSFIEWLDGFSDGDEEQLTGWEE